MKKGKRVIALFLMILMMVVLLSCKIFGGKSVFSVVGGSSGSGGGGGGGSGGGGDGGAGAPGSLDNAFGNTGIVTTNIGSNTNDEANAVAIQNDGKIVVAGFTRSSSNFTSMVMLRYNTDGTLDNSFGNNGILIIYVSPISNYGNSVEIQSDGKIVITGEAGNNIVVLRVNTDGSMDTNFGNGGVVTTDLNNGDMSDTLKIHSDGKIIVVGLTNTNNGANNDMVVLRYNPDGSLDSSFDSDGIVITSINSGNDFASDVALQSDGKIVVVGMTNNGNDNDIAVMRYNP